MIIILVCIQCWQKKEGCECKEKNIERLVEIDDKIASAIQKLNLLGYKTNYCCEGHTDERYIQAYIVFAWDKDTKVFATLPEGWRYDSYSYKKNRHYKYNIIRSIIPEQRKLNRMTEKQKQEVIDSNINNLIQWVEQLGELH